MQDVRAFIIGICACFIASPAFAQTDAGPMLRPWPDDRKFEFLADGVFLNQGHTKDSREKFDLIMYESVGRFRFRPDLRLSPTIGYDLMYLDINTDDPGIPTRLSDQSIGFGTPIGMSGDWFFALAGGLGYAGNTPFNDSSAWYGKGTFIAGRELEKDSSLIFALDYNGNRTVYPDIPFPAVAYTKRIHPTLLAVAGFPFSSIRWEPIEKLTIEVMYSIPDSFDARIGYDITDRWRVFASYEGRREGFTISDYDNNDRLFFEQRRVEAGIRWRPAQFLALVAAGGYAFNQEFSRGWDMRDTEEVADVSDEAYVRVGVEYRP